MGALDGKVALVTGASRGIGRAIALELARAGSRVAVNYRSGEAAAQAVAEEINAIGRANKRSEKAGALAREMAPHTALLVQADVADAQQARELVRRVLDEWGRLEVLVNNAGITRDRTLRKLSDEDWTAVVETNLNSVFFCTSAAMPAMIEQRYGRIVNITSLIAQTGAVGQANYAAAKGGMTSFTRSAALELAKHNITVNAVAPGYTETDMFANVPDNVQDQIKARIPLGRFARPEEIAKAVLFLVADGDYITGQQIPVNGGICM